VYVVGCKFHLGGLHPTTGQKAEEIMSRNIPVSKQLEKQLTIVKDKFARLAENGTHPIHAYLIRNPTDVQQLGYVLQAMMEFEKASGNLENPLVCRGGVWLDFFWQLPFTDQKADLSTYQSLASDALIVTSSVVENIREVAEQIPARVVASFPGMEAMYWTWLLFWLALVVRDDPLLRATVYTLNEKRPHPTSYSFAILPEGVAPDSPEWPEMGFAKLSCDLFTASERACDWLLVQIAKAQKHLQYKDPSVIKVEGNKNTKSERSSKGGGDTYNIYGDHASLGKGARHSYVGGDYFEGNKNEVGTNCGEVVFGDKSIVSGGRKDNGDKGIKDFIQKYWQWIIGTLITLAGLWLAYTSKDTKKEAGQPPAQVPVIVNVNPKIEQNTTFKIDNNSSVAAKPDIPDANGIK
jgi:hypothetical protein